MGDATAEFMAGRMSKTTQHVRLDDVSDKENPLPNMLCSLEQWKEHMRKLRIRKTDNILLYDHMGFFSVARVALMFRYFGAQKVRIIDGGMKKWVLEGKPTYGGEYIPGEGLEAEGDYSYEVINEEIFVRNISNVHTAA
jgi:thiosulfate/3-mercaptopyruvate sulfurtransferase